MKERVIDLVKKVLALGEDYDASALEKSDLLVLGMDSIAAIQLIIMLESEFNIEFSDEDIMLHTVQSIDSIVSTIGKYI